MKIELANKKLNQVSVDIEIIFIVNKNLQHAWVKDFKLFNKINFSGEAETTAFFPEKQRLYIGLTSLNNDDVRIAAAKATQMLGNTKYKSAKIGLYGGQSLSDNAQAMAEGFILGSYNFNKYKSKPQPSSLAKVIIAFEEYENKKINIEQIKKAVARGIIIASATNFTRDIVNNTPAEMHPVEFSRLAKKVAQANKFKITVYGEKYLEREGLEAFLAVSKASPYPPQLIHLVYKPARAGKKIVLVGKGLTFDSGGLSLKPSDSMLTMKSDKSGASAILGIMQAARQLKLPVEIHGIIGATENVVGHQGYKPDDILKAKNGKTIEVKNTDAEGRLVLADCLSYAQEIKHDYLIDIATLTGACVVGLGEYTIGAMGFNRNLINDLLAAGEKSGELVAYLPFNHYLQKLIKSEIADISNLSSSRYGGAITGGLFLAEFIEAKNQDKWFHLDIAGPAYLQKAWGVNPYGATGAGVRIIIKFLESLA